MCRTFNHIPLLCNVPANDPHIISGNNFKWFFKECVMVAFAVPKPVNLDAPQDQLQKDGRLPTSAIPGFIGAYAGVLIDVATGKDPLEAVKHGITRGILELGGVGNLRQQIMNLAFRPDTAATPTGGSATTTTYDNNGPTTSISSSPSTDVKPPQTTPGIATDKSNITQLANRAFCMNDRGNVLLPERSQVPHIGERIQGTPSYGEALRAICEGVQHLKDMNGGTLPDGHPVTLQIKIRNGEDTVSREIKLNPDSLSSVANLGPAALRSAMADPMNRKAIQAIRNSVDLEVVHNAPGALTSTFLGKEPGEKVSLTVALMD